MPLIEIKHRKVIPLALTFAVLFVSVTDICPPATAGGSDTIAAPRFSLHFAAGLQSTAQSANPRPAPARFRELIGEYGPDDDILIILEKDGRLCALFKRTDMDVLDEVSRGVFRFSGNTAREGWRVTFKRDRTGRVAFIEMRMDMGGGYAGAVALLRRQIEPETGNQLRIKPVRPVAELMKEALAAQPPTENGDLLQSDLVELTRLDPTIRLEVRYATRNNFLGTKFYSEARAFMQRPAAEAVVRAHRKLKRSGYGLLVHDAYRPWYVTKVFWDAVPADKKVFVADPSRGSRHNRGCAVDLTLYDLRTKRAVEMVSTYDETTTRAHADYPGGTSLQRWHRKLLRDAMEAEGFTVYEVEWWHFDYKDWRRYPIGNVRFEAIGKRSSR